jgi:predicted nuclease of predicted toxin-antitoxin system
VKLLFDQNLPPALAYRLRDLFPGSEHVFPLGLAAVPDEQVWTFAKTYGFTLLTKDADFSELSLLRGFPPKVVWLRTGNCTTTQVEALIRSSTGLLKQLENDPEAGLVVLR